MKVLVKEKAYYNNTIVKAGQIIEIKEKKVPSWAEAIKKDTQDIADNQALEGVQNGVENDTVEDTKLLDELLTKAIEKNIDVDLTNKSVVEQIAVLSQALEGVQKCV